MSGFWLRCDACNKQMAVEVDSELQLAIRFKPSLFRRVLERLHPEEQRHRCRSCGWVNVFVPAAAQANSSLTPNWRSAIVVK